MSAGMTKLKQHYLGGIYPGQDLCWARITVLENQVWVSRYRAGRLMATREYTDPSQVIFIKGKLRAFVMRGNPRKRWSTKKVRHAFEIFIYYPSRSWDSGSGKVLVKWFDGL